MLVLLQSMKPRQQAMMAPMRGAAACAPASTGFQQHLLLFDLLRCKIPVRQLL
jgi:hypothetical protein